MPTFKFVARDISGRPHTGAIVAPTLKEARTRLRDRQLYVTALEDGRPSTLRSLLRSARPAA